MCHNFFVSDIDRRELLVRDRDKLLRHTARNQRVRMIFTHKAMIGLAQIITRNIGRNAEDQIRIGLVGPQMARPDTRELDFREAEDVSNRAQIFKFGRVDILVRLSDVKERVDDVFEHGRIISEDRGDLLGIGLKARNVLLSDTIDTVYVRLLGIRHFHDFFKGADFRIRYLTVSFGHFGRKRDEGDGEDNFLVGKRTVDDKVACHRTDKSAQWSANGKTKSGTCYFTPNRHEQILVAFGSVRTQQFRKALRTFGDNLRFLPTTRDFRPQAEVRLRYPDYVSRCQRTYGNFVR